MVETWLSGDSSPNISELAGLIDALDQLKHHAFQKLQDDTEREREPHVPTRMLRTRNTDLRPSKRGRSTADRGSTSKTKKARHHSDSLFINDDDPNSDSDQTEETHYEQESHVSTTQSFSEIYGAVGQTHSISAGASELNKTTWESTEPPRELDEPAWAQGSVREQSVRLPGPEAALLPVPTQQSSNQRGSIEEPTTVAEPSNGEDVNAEIIEQASRTNIAQYRMQSQHPSSAEFDELGYFSDGNQSEIDLFLDIDSPRYFDEAFGERFGHEHGTTAHSPVSDTMELEHSPRSFENDPEFLPHLELAYRMGFCLPQECVGATDETSVRERLSPLLEEKPLNMDLLHGILYTVLPGPLRIFELGSMPSKDDFPGPEELVERFVAILPASDVSTTLLILGDPKSKALHILGSKSAGTPALNTFRTLLPHWKEEFIDVRTHSSSCSSSV